MYLNSFSLLNTLALSEPSTFKMKSIWTSPIIKVSSIPPIGTPILPLKSIFSLISVDRVTPKKGRMVVFDGLTLHASSMPSKDYRISLNLGYADPRLVQKVWRKILCLVGR